MLNPKLSTASVYYSDGIQHLSEAGYLAITPMIEAWMRNMYVPGVAAGGSGGVTSWNDLTDKPFGENENAVLLPVTQFFYDESADAFAAPGYIKFVVGKTYTVNWNGTNYTSEAVSGTIQGMPVVFVGNPVVAGGDNNNLPFVVACFNNFIGAIPLDGSAAVTVGVTGYSIVRLPAKYSSTYIMRRLSVQVDEGSYRIYAIEGLVSEVESVLQNGGNVILADTMNYMDGRVITTHIPLVAYGKNLTGIGNATDKGDGIHNCLMFALYSSNGSTMPHETVIFFPQSDGFYST
jgi:hypothetical protein